SSRTAPTRCSPPNRRRSTTPSGAIRRCSSRSPSRACGATCEPRMTDGSAAVRDAARHWRLAALCAGGLVAGCSGSSGPGELVAGADRHWPTIERYCVDCHNDIDLTADIAFDRMGPEAVAHDPEL